MIRRSNVDVIAPVLVAALVNGNDIVGVFDAVDNQGSIIGPLPVEARLGVR